MIVTRVRDTLATISIALTSETIPNPRDVEYLFAVSDEIVDHEEFQLLGCGLHILDRVAVFAAGHVEGVSGPRDGALWGLGLALKGIALAWSELVEISPPEAFEENDDG